MDINELHKNLLKHIHDQSKNWKSFIYAQEKSFYQGFEQIGIIGCRPTEKRFDRYSVKKYLTDSKTVLDIGSNCGFFSIYISKFVNHVTGVEINPYLVSIANDVNDFLGIKNTTFYNLKFEKFDPGKKFDIVLSLANDSTIDDNTKISFEQYIKKITIHLKKDGLLIFESQALDAIVPGAFDFKRKILEKYFKILEDRMVESEYPINVPKRIFLVLQKMA